MTTPDPTSGNTRRREDERAVAAVTLHSLAWLAFGNLAGLLLATLLLVPSLGDALGELTYGRWMPVHLNAQLYGWCALPLVGLLLRIYLEDARLLRLAPLALGAWSGSLLVGTLSWLLGASSGKPFLEWSGPAAAVFAIAMAVLGTVLLLGFVRQVAPARAARRPRPLLLVPRGLLLAALLALPLLIFRVSQPDVYPAYNPDSGGATGWSLLGSTLVVVGIFLLTPFVMGLERRRSKPPTGLLVAVLAAHLAWVALLDHGNHSHHEWLQIVSLGSLAIWPPLLARFFRSFDWPRLARRWLIALAAWGIALVASGWLSFLPGVLEAEKFTNALVAHAHLAMAGMASSFCMLVLIGLDRRGRLSAILGSRRPFGLWQAGSVLQIVALLALGLLESRDAGLLFRTDATATLLYFVRWCGGAAMLAASIEWAARAVGVRLPREAATRVPEEAMAR